MGTGNKKPSEDNELTSSTAAGYVPNLAPIRNSNRSKMVLILTMLILFLIGTAAWYVARNNRRAANLEKAQHQAEESGVEVQITENGFEPAEVNIVPGTKVIWVNKTSKPKQIGADPYPTHDTLPDFYSADPIPAKESYSFVFNMEGNFGYHDSSKPSTVGTVKVSKFGRF